MEMSPLLNAVFALLFVLGLIALINVGLRRYGPEKLFYSLQKKKGAKRLSV